jgi:HD domain
MYVTRCTLSPHYLHMSCTLNFLTKLTLHYIVADRLHTMRTLRSLPLEEKERLKIAEEALNVYAPLAHRMGVMKVKGELEDLAFKILHPEMFQVRKASLPNTSASITTDTVNFSPRIIADITFLSCLHELSLIHLPKYHQQLLFDLMRFLQTQY